MSGDRYFFVSGGMLKAAAALTMFIDHFGACFLYRGMEANGIYIDFNTMQGAGVMGWSYLLCRLVGRIAFPLFIFLLAEGAGHTSNCWRYLGRLCVFALISEIPFDMAFWLSDFQIQSGQLVETGHQNVFFTMALGLLAINMNLLICNNVSSKPLKIFLSAASGIAAVLLANALNTDYGGVGVAAILACWYLRKNRMLSAAAVCTVLMLSSVLEFAAYASLLLVRRYDGTRGRQPKYFFYIFYPAHLLALYFLAFAVF